MSKLSYLDANTLTNEKIEYYNKVLKIDQTVKDMKPESRRKMITWILEKLQQ